MEPQAARIKIWNFNDCLPKPMCSGSVHELWHTLQSNDTLLDRTTLHISVIRAPGLQNPFWAFWPDRVPVSMLWLC